MEKESGNLVVSAIYFLRTGRILFFVGVNLLFYQIKSSVDLVHGKVNKLHTGLHDKND